MSLVFGSAEHYSEFRKRQASTSITPTCPHLHSCSTAPVGTKWGGYAGVLSQKNSSFSNIPDAQHYSFHKCYSYCYPGSYCHCLLRGHSPKSDHRLEKSQVLSVDGSMVECNDLFRGKGYSCQYLCICTSLPKVLGHNFFFCFSSPSKY